MKHKKILLVVFFLTLFVFQKAQARTNILPSPARANNVSPALLADDNVSLFTDVYVLWWLVYLYL